MIKNLPLESVVFCRRHSVSPIALAITAVALVVIGAAMTYGLLPPFSNYGIAPGLVIIALGTLVGGLALYANSVSSDIIFKRKGTALFFATDPDSQPAARSAKALLQRLGIYNSSIIAVSRHGIRKDDKAEKLHQINLNFLQTLFDEKRLPKQGLRIRVIDKTLQTALKHTTQLFRVPEEVFPQILFYLSKRDLLNFARCNSTTFRLSQDRDLWRERKFRPGIPIEKLHFLLFAQGKSIHHLRLHNIYDHLMYCKVWKLVSLYCPYLKDLSLVSCCIEKENAKALANGFKNFRNLESLNFHVNEVGNEGTIAIANSFESISSLLSLNLDSTMMGTAGAEAISHNLCHLPNLEILQLGNNWMRTTGVTEIANNLVHTPNLRKLGLRFNSFEAEGGKAIANNLCYINHLQELNVNNNNDLGNEGITAIAHKFPDVPYLKSFSCQNTSMGSAGAGAIAANLKHVKNLQQLELGNNPIGDQGATAIANNLRHTTDLTRLRMWTNGIGNAGAIAIANNLHHITKLRNLVLWKNQIGSEGTEAISNNLGCVPYIHELNLDEQQVDEENQA